MKHHWQARRQLVERPDGQQRWDRAYEQLLRWVLSPGVCDNLVDNSNRSSTQEVSDEDCSLRARFDTAAD